MGDYCYMGQHGCMNMALRSYPGPLIKKFARSMRNEAFGDVELLHNLSSRILERFLTSRSH